MKKLVFISCVACGLLFHSSYVLDNSETRQSRLDRVYKNASPTRISKGDSLIQKKLPPNKEWTATVPDIEIQPKDSKGLNYKRAYGIIERSLPIDWQNAEKIKPNTVEGLKRIKEAVGLNSPSTKLVLGRSYPPDAQGLVTSRLNVLSHNIPVFGSEIIVNQRQAVDGFKEEIVKDVIKEVPRNLPTRPQLSLQAAFQKSTQDAKDSSGIQDLKVKLLSSRLVYFPGKETLNLAWHLKVATEGYQKDELPEPPGKWNYFVDSVHGEILTKGNDVQTETNPEVLSQASGPGGNEGFGNDRPWDQELDVIFNSNVNEYQMDTSRFVTIDLKGTEPPEVDYMIVGVEELLKLGNKVGSGTDLALFGNRPLNNAHGYAEQTLNMLKEFGYSSINEMGLKLPSLVNYSQGYDNAFWDGEKMVYGGGGDYFYDLASDLGVVAHEIDHGFTQYHSGLFYWDESGGLNESFSDIAGATAKFFANNLDNNFLIGEKVIKRKGPLGDQGFLRHMCSPTRDGFYSWDGTLVGSVDKYSDYYDGLDVHYSSGIMNKAFCRFAKRISTNGDPKGLASREGVLRAAKVFFDANKTKWGVLSTFRSAASGTIRSAVNLGFSEAEIGFLKDSWDDVGVESTPTTFVVTVNGLQNGTASLYQSFSKILSCNPSQTECSVTVDKGESLGLLFKGKKGWRVEGAIGCESFFEVSEGFYCQVKVLGDVTLTPVIGEFSELPGIPNPLTRYVSWGKVYLNWSEPVINGGHAITDYVVQYSSDSGASWTTYDDGVSTERKAEIVGLKSGVSYVFRVAAVNSEGTGKFTDPSESVVIIVKPGLVKNLVGTPGNKEVSLSWSPPDDDGGSPVLNYSIEYYSNDGATWDNMLVPTQAVQTIVNLTNGQKYIFKVRACNKRECGNYITSGTIIPSAPPEAPLSFSVTAGDTKANLQWTAPKSNGGSEILDYVVQYSSNKGGTWITFIDGVSPNKSAIVTGLKNGTSYVFRCAAKNSVGTGNFTAPSSPITPLGPPSAPVMVTGTAGDRQVRLSWSVPSDSGGRPITDYVIQFSTNSGLTWNTIKDGVSASASSMVTGLNNGLPYTFRVAASNNLGVGSFSSSSAVFIPMGVPTAPRNLSGAPGNRQVALSWFVPASDNGSAITDYIIEYYSDLGRTWKVYEDGVSSGLSATIRGVNIRGTTFFKVRGRNTVGLGAYSSVVLVKM